MTSYNKISVELLVKQGQFAKGDIAGFREDVAKRLVEAGYAKYHEEGPVLEKPSLPKPSLGDIKQMNSGTGNKSYVTK